MEMKQIEKLLHFLSFIYLFKVNLINGQGLVFEGSAEEPENTCTLKSGENGLCKSISDCPDVLANFQTVPPTHCGFQGSKPVVCCPLIVDFTEGPTIIPHILPRTDLSQPIMDFECGKQKTSLITDEEFLTTKRRKRFIVGGSKTFLGEWPWMALLGANSSEEINWFCDGVLINPNWVLSAAHCVSRRVVDVVRLGELDVSSSSDGAYPVNFGVSSEHLHPDYHPATGYHDLVLLKLEESAPLTIPFIRISPVCLPWSPENQESLVDTDVTITGWGATEFGGESSPILQKVEITVFNSSTCDESYSTLPNYDTHWPQGITEETTICAGNTFGGKDACQGDSGGPMVFYDSTKDVYTLAGIVSKGYGCGQADFPGLYVAINRPNYLGWIKKIAF